jgi:hypothetical protein
MLPFILSVALTLAFGLAFKAWHKWQLRRSPLQGRKMGHLPGQQLFERIAHHDTEVMTAIMVMYFALPLMFTLWAGWHLDWAQLHWGVQETIVLVGAIGMFIYGLVDYVRNYRARERARDGLLAERVTGMQLNRLVAQSCLVMHDLPAEGFNIDHVVIAPRGVYAVETKSFRKPKHLAQGESHRVAYDGRALRFPDFIEKGAVAQAERQSQWLARLLREALQCDVPVIPALALPGWHIEPNEDVWRTSSVKVFSPMGNGANFMAKPAEKLNANQRSLIAQALALRYPEVSD